MEKEIKPCSDNEYKFIFSSLIDDSNQEVIKETDKIRISRIEYVHNGRSVACLLKVYKNNSRVYSVYSQLKKAKKHKNISIIYECFFYNNNTYIVEEYVVGRTLRELIEEKKEEGKIYSEAEVVEIISQICEGVTFLNSQKPTIFHRDIKPENIIIKDDGVVKLIDFDAAKEKSDVSKSKDTVCMGTEEYCAHEAYGGHETKCQSDVYSIGVVMHEMLTGECYGKDGKKLTVEKSDEGINKGKVYDNIIYKGKIRRIIRGCVWYDFSKRYANANALKKELLNYNKLPKGIIVSVLLFAVILLAFILHIPNGLDHKAAIDNEIENNTRQIVGDNAIPENESSIDDTAYVVDEEEKVLNDLQKYKDSSTMPIEDISGEDSETEEAQNEDIEGENSTEEEATENQQEIVSEPNYDERVHSISLSDEGEKIIKLVATKDGYCTLRYTNSGSIYSRVYIENQDGKCIDYCVGQETYSFGFNQYDDRIYFFNESNGLLKINCDTMKIEQEYTNVDGKWGGTINSNIYFLSDEVAIVANKNALYDLNSRSSVGVLMLNNSIVYNDEIYSFDNSGITCKLDFSGKKIKEYSFSHDNYLNEMTSDMFCEYNGYLYYIIGDSIYRFDGDSEELYLELSSFKYYSNENWNKFAISNSGIYYMSDKKPKTLFMITNNM